MLHGKTFVYMPNKDIMREYFFDCDECLCLNFLSCVKNTSNSMALESEDCLLDEENDPTKIFGFGTISSFVTLISCTTENLIILLK